MTPKERAGRQLFEEFLSDFDAFEKKWGAHAYEDFECGPWVSVDYFPSSRDLQRHYDEASNVRQHFEELAIKRGLVHGEFVERS